MLEWKEEWAYEGGVTAAGLYHAGSMLSDDSQGDAEDDSLVMLVTDTNEGEYKAYLEKLCGTGFEKVFENHTAAVDCCQLKKRTRCCTRTTPVPGAKCGSSRTGLPRRCRSSPIHTNSLLRRIHRIPLLPVKAGSRRKSISTGCTMTRATATAPPPPTAACSTSSACRITGW